MTNSKAGPGRAVFLAGTPLDRIMADYEATVVPQIGFSNFDRASFMSGLVLGASLGIHDATWTQCALEQSTGAPQALDEITASRDWIVAHPLKGTE